MWLNDIIGACCIIWALIQTRTVLVYIGILKSAVIPDYQTPPSALVHSAMEDAISFFIFGFLFFVFSWPEIVTYILSALLLRAIANVFLAVLGVGRFGAVEPTKKGKTRQALLETVPVFAYFVGTWASAHFLGW